MTAKVKPTVEKWEEINKKLRLCPECWTLSEGTGYCDCGGFKRLDFNDLPEEEKRAWVDGFERGESLSVQEAKVEKYKSPEVEVVASSSFEEMLKLPDGQAVIVDVAKIRKAVQEAKAETISMIIDRIEMWADDGQIPTTEHITSRLSYLLASLKQEEEQ